MTFNEILPYLLTAGGIYLIVFLIFFITVASLAIYMFIKIIKKMK